MKKDRTEVYLAILIAAGVALLLWATYHDSYHMGYTNGIKDACNEVAWSSPTCDRKRSEYLGGSNG